MKKNINIIVMSILTAIVLTISCKKEPIIKDDFGFQAEIITSTNEIKVLQRSEVKLKIVPNKKVTTTQYEVSYEITAGSGNFELSDGTQINSDTFIKIENLLSILYYKPTTIGNHTIKFTFRDNKKNTFEKELNFDVIYSNFQLELTASAPEFYINTENNLTLTLNSDAQGDFTVNYTISGGSGNLMKNGVSLTTGQDYTFSSGSNILVYKPTTIGTHTITMNATAPDGATNQVNLSINVIHVPFTFTATGTLNSISINENLPITINLASIITSGVNYQIKYEMISGNGIVKNQNDITLTAGQFYNIDLGTYTYTFFPSEEGSLEIKFTVKDLNGQEIESSVTITVGMTEFVFTAAPGSNNVIINESVPISLSITTNGNETGMNYKLSFINISGTGELKDSNNQSLSPGTDILLGDSPGSWIYYYTPLTLGTHEIKFTVTSAFGLSHEVTINLTATHIPVNFTVGTSGTDFIINQELPINININSSDQTITYELMYQILQGSGLLKDENNNIITASVYNSVNQGNLIYHYKPTTLGTHEIKFFLRDSNGQILQQTISINVSNVIFTFTGSAQNLTLYQNESTLLNFNITETAPSGTNYQMMFNYSQGQGIVKQNNNDLLTNTWYNVPIGNFNWEFLATQVGQVDLNFFVKNTTTLEIQNITVSIDVLNIPDCNVTTFNVTATQNSEIVNHTIALDFDFTEQNGNCTPGNYKFYYISNKNSQIIYNGNTYSQNQQIPITPGTFSIDYKGIEQGQHNISFYIININNQNTETTNISLTFDYADFNINAPTIKTGYPLNTITFPVNINGGDGDITLKVIRLSNNTSSILKVNRATSSYNTIINVPSSFLIEFTPSQIGNDSFKLEVTRGGLTKTKNIEINVLQPQFTINNINIPETWGDRTTNLSFDINTDYNNDLNYNIQVKVFDNANNLIDSHNLTQQGRDINISNIELNPNSHFGNLRTEITVTDANYGYSLTENSSFLSKDFNFNFNGISISRSTDYDISTHYIRSDSRTKTKYYNNLLIDFNVVEKEYPITQVKITYNHWITNEKGDQLIIQNWDFDYKPFSSHFVVKDNNNLEVHVTKKYSNSDPGNNIVEINPNNLGWRQVDSDLKWVYQLFTNGSLIIRNLDMPISGQSPNVLTIELIDSNNNSQIKNFTLTHGWGNYTPDN